MIWVFSWSRVRAAVDGRGVEEWVVHCRKRSNFKKECRWRRRRMKNYLPWVSVILSSCDQKEEAKFRTKSVFSLHREPIRFKPGPSTRYFICQLWNITNTWQMFNNPALLCLSLSNNTLLGAWFWEATVQRMWMGGKAACQKREEQCWQKLQNFCELYSSADIQMSLPGRWNHQQRVLPKHCLNEQMLHFPSSVVIANCWGS